MPYTQSISMPLFSKVPMLQWRIRVARNARAEDFGNSNVGLPFHSLRTSLALLLTLIIQLCDWRQSVLSANPLPHFFGYTYAPFFELMLRW